MVSTVIRTAENVFLVGTPDQTDGECVKVYRYDKTPGKHGHFCMHCEVLYFDSDPSPCSFVWMVREGMKQ